MRQTELHLSEEARSIVDGIRAKGLHHAREVNRAHILSCLDRGIPESQIMDVLGVGRTAVWRVRAAYHRMELHSTRRRPKTWAPLCFITYVLTY